MDDVTEPVAPAASPWDHAATFPRSGILATALARRGKEGFSGTLRVDGGHGGDVTLRDGVVVAASTPVAPGIESLLLRSGRIAEADWTAVYREAAPYGRLAAELVERGLLGAATVEIITQTSVFDAIFAIALTGVSACTAERSTPDDLAPLLPVEPGLDVERVIRETTRRMEAAAEWRRFGLTINSRPYPLDTATSQATAPSRLEILAEVNGRWTTRDIAFSRGRGLYSVLTDLAILFKDGLVGIDPVDTYGLPVDPPQVGTARLDEVPIAELGLGDLPAPPEHDLPELTPSEPAEAPELPRRRRLLGRSRHSPE
jgi:hypothetical protein